MVAVNYKFLEVTSSRGLSHGVEVTLLFFCAGHKYVTQCGQGIKRL